MEDERRVHKGRQPTEGEVKRQIDVEDFDWIYCFYENTWLPKFNMPTNTISEKLVYKMRR